MWFMTPPTRGSQRAPHNVPQQPPVCNQLRPRHVHSGDADKAAQCVSGHTGHRRCRRHVARHDAAAPATTQGCAACTPSEWHSEHTSSQLSNAFQWIVKSMVYCTAPQNQGGQPCAMPCVLGSRQRRRVLLRCCRLEHHAMCETARHAVSQPLAQVTNSKPFARALPPRQPLTVRAAPRERPRPQRAPAPERSAGRSST